MSNCKNLQRAMICIILALLLAGTVMSMIPHAHDCSSCIICAMIEASEELLLLALCSSIGTELLLQGHSILLHSAKCPPTGGKTLVGLKVKLSD